jgi:hypothetical protein
VTVVKQEVVQTAHAKAVHVITAIVKSQIC